LIRNGSIGVCKTLIEVEQQSRIEDIMATTQQYFHLVQTGKSSWKAVHIVPPVDTVNEDTIAPADNAKELFKPAATSDITLAERFPRAAIALVAIALFGATLTTEIDLLRGAGFHWR
jgi:hypothetical protein